MRSFSAIVFAAFVALLASPAAAHMEMKEPLPFRSKYNPKNTDANIDYSMTAPLDASGSNFPCKGYHTDGGEATATYAAGGSYTVQLVGGANHNGGSCQLSLSYDNGATWEVIKSFIGNCPAGLEASLNFEMPSDVKTGKALFAWTWFNNTGNREMYMNCAPIEITAGNAKRSPAKRATRPAMFEANINNGCSTAEGLDVVFPDAGSVVETAGNKGTSPPIGNCGASKPSTPQAAQSNAPSASSAAPTQKSTAAPSPSVNLTPEFEGQSVPPADDAADEEFEQCVRRSRSRRNL